MIYKVSFVVQGDAHPGGIQNLDHKPEVGEELLIGNSRLQIVQVTELLPPMGDYAYLHATCRLIEIVEPGKNTDGNNA